MATNSLLSAESITAAVRQVRVASEHSRQQSLPGLNLKKLVKSEDPGETKTRYGPDGDYSHIGIGTQSETAASSADRDERSRAPAAKTLLESTQNDLVWRLRLS